MTPKLASSPWTTGVVLLFACGSLLLVCGGLVAAGTTLATHVAVAELHQVYFNRLDLPDLGPFMRFELPTIGHVYDTGGRPLIELARESREITRREDLPPIVRDAILAAEDKRFFSHNGIDYFSVPRVLGKVRVGMLARRWMSGGRADGADGAALFPQGGSTITQQLVRGSFLHRVMARENSYQLRHAGLGARLLAKVVGVRSVNMLARKREEMRLSVWIEHEMRTQFGSKRRAKEEILARYASSVYMGNGQYGFARAAEYYFGRPLSTFTADDADSAAVLAGIAKSPRAYAPDGGNTDRVVRRRNQTLAADGGQRLPVAGSHRAGAGAGASHRAPRPAPGTPGARRRRARAPGARDEPSRARSGGSPPGPGPGVRDGGCARPADRERRARARARAIRAAASVGARRDPGRGRRAAQPGWTDSGASSRA